MFSGIKKMWADTGVTTAIDGVIRLAAKGDALEVQRWYFKLRKDAYKISLRDGISPSEVERRALDSIDPEKARLFKEIVKRLSQPGGVLEEVNDYFMRPAEVDGVHTTSSDESLDSPVIESDGDLVLESGPSDWEEYSNIDQGPSDDPIIDESRDPLPASRTLTWDEWYKMFKIAAANANPQLEGGDNGMSFLDFMEHEPLRRAFEDGVDPELLAVGFAAQFDMSDVLNRGTK